MENHSKNTVYALQNDCQQPETIDMVFQFNCNIKTRTICCVLKRNCYFQPGCYSHVFLHYDIMLFYSLCCSTL